MNIYVWTKTPENLGIEYKNISDLVNQKAWQLKIPQNLVDFDYVRDFIDKIFGS